jgi:arsenite-transporting ATPase
VLNFLENPRLRLLFFGGKGGVGKTTCATATACHYAGRFCRRTVLLVSTDPAHSLADSLADFIPPANLKILEFKAQEALEDFKTRHHPKLKEIAARGTFLDEEDISQFLDLSLPGLDELMALLAIAKWVENRDYDLVIVDTAPTGHTLRLLTMPELIRQWLKALDALLAKHRFMRQRFRGIYRPDELDDFLVELASAVKEMVALWRDARRCRFVPVMLAEEVVVSETEKLLKELERRQIPVREVVVNRLYPESPCPVCTAGRRHQWRILEQLLSSGRLARYLFWSVPLSPQEVRGQSLEAFWDGVTPLAGILPLPPPLLNLPPRVEAPPACPDPGTTFLIFAGKGGVGKTTLACATALRLARDLPAKEIFLFSTDPAHSLAACLGVTLGSQPVRLGPNLTAMEMDAPGEFAAWKRHYHQELEKFLQGAFENFDLPFDRQVMERLLDLSPPGLDEIMALVRALEFMEAGRYQLFILDSAPTGHLIRLLELPELIEQWLQTFFGFFLKYKLAFRLPELSQHLVRISRKVKFLRRLWRDPACTALYAVTIPTEMALAETVDLLAAGDRLGVNTPVLFLNLITPAGDCPLCTALNRREAQVREKFRQAFPHRHQTLIYRQTEPRGRQRLEKLGQALYRPQVGENLHGAVIDLPGLSN